MTAVAVRPLPASPPEPGEVQPVEHETLDRIITGTGHRRCRCWRWASPPGRPGTACCTRRPRRLRDHLRADRAGRHGRLPPPLHAPQLQDAAGGRAACSRSSAPPRSRARSSRGSPTTASTTRSRTAAAIRTARTSTTAAAGAARSAACCTRTSAGCSSTTSAAPATRYAPDLLADPVDRASSTARSSLWALAGLALPFGLGWRSAARSPPALTGLLWGGARADARPAPRHLQHQLDLPLLRPPPLRDHRRVAQRLLARAARPSASPGTTTTTPSRPRPRHGLGRWQFDPSALVIRGLEACGLAWDVVRVSPERQAARPRCRVQRGVGAHEAALIPAVLRASLAVPPSRGDGL